jgi:hypothetical protein
MKRTPQKFSSYLQKIVAIGIVIFMTSCDNNPFDNKTFNQKDWQNKSLRLEMSEDLQKTHLKTGMTRSSTIKLLGKPDFVNSYCPDKNNCEGYYLGEYVLVVSFDKAGKLVKTAIVSI